MANLRLITELHNKYKSQFNSIEFDLVSLNEAIDSERFENALSDKVAELGQLFTTHFEHGSPANLSLLFIDICSFSTRNAELSDVELVQYLDGYYDIILPIIFEYGGEIDKIMGDGVICLFGAPFLSNELMNNIELAFKCSKALIKKTKGTIYESKIAIHAGQIRYYKNKSVHYEEYTIVGKMMTELFRLESISEDAKINFYSNSNVDEFIQSKIPTSSGIPRFSEIIAKWVVSRNNLISPKLKGVEFENYKTIKYNN